MNKSQITSLKQLLTHLLDEQNKRIVGFDKLPIYHTTHYEDYYTYIIRDKALSTNPKKCKFFNENLLYFFFGKAPYWRKEDQVDSYSLNPPYTLGYKSQSLENYALIRIFPFDSGGYKDGRYKILGSKLIELFELHTNPRSVEDFINLFYGNLNNYINIQMEINFELQDFIGCIPAQKLKKFNESLKVVSGNTNFGEQAFTVELQYGNIEIPDSPEVIFVPEYMYRNEKQNLLSHFKETFPKLERVVKYPCKQNDKVAARYMEMQKVIKQYSNYKISL